MASGFQRSKIAGVFNAMDTDGDGYLRESDFQELTSRWTRRRGAAEGTEQHARLTAIMMGWWQTLLAVCDEDGDGRASLAEVLLVVDKLPAMAGAVDATAAAMFEAVDADADGSISAAEYRSLIEAWNGRPTDTDEIFPLLDADGDGALSLAEFTALWTEFWTGDDPNAPGTWVFGRFGASAAD